jgi:hypothetical protein
VPAARQAASDGVGRVLEAVGAASGIVRQLQQHYARAVAPRVEESAAEAAACATGLASLVRAVEERVLAALQASLSAFFVQVRARRRRAAPAPAGRQVPGEAARSGRRAQRGAAGARAVERAARRAPPGRGAPRGRRLRAADRAAAVGRAGGAPRPAHCARKRGSLTGGGLPYRKGW